MFLSLQLCRSYGKKLKDAVILFAAVYYISNAEKFVNEYARVLCPGGMILIATTNKDLYDFNPSPHSCKYYGVSEMDKLFGKYGFACKFFGYLPVDEVSLRQKILRPFKKVAVSLNLMPKTMAGKKF